MKKISMGLYNKLDKLAKQEIDVFFWEQFYEFVIASYNLPPNNRFSVSELFFELKKRDFDHRADLVKFYSHGMYLLAKYNNLEIYGEGFNI